MPNHLLTVSSPYLRMHAHNPVDWYPWSAEALEKARREDKPIFLSIGYLACHWCHVMARESFEDPQTAAIMNEHFVNIKVDREERPDLDSLYMQATVALSGSGGWPMSVFLTPDLQPFYAGTYFPPTPRYGMPSFRQVLAGLANAWRERRADIQQVAQEVMTRLQESARLQSRPFAPQRLNEAQNVLLQTYDWANGGWGPAPKFPQAMALDFLLMRFLETTEGELLRLVCHNLDAMAQGGMYDLPGGGFHRYSTDARWRIPHYEKMLYDNALLARVYLHAWQITGRERYLKITLQTLDFVARELTSPEGGFYSSLAADSEGEEGKFYLWTVEELRQTLGSESELFVAAHGIAEHKPAGEAAPLQRALDDASLAVHFGLDPAQARTRLEHCYRLLLEARAARPRPETDDKILASWNGLMLAAFAEAARALSALPETSAAAESPANPETVLRLEKKRRQYLDVATRNADFLLAALRPAGRLHRSWRAGVLGSYAFLEDYGALLLGLLELYQTDFQTRWFRAALDLTEEMLHLFSHPEGGFYDTPADLHDLPLRSRDLQDNAVPSGNALAAAVLLKLAALTERLEWRARAEQTLGLVEALAGRYPTAFGFWLQAAQFASAGVRQTAILGAPEDPQTQTLLRRVWAGWRPMMVLAAANFPPPPDAPPLLQNRSLLDGRPTAYVCENFVCRQPVNEAGALQKLLQQP